MPEAVKMYSKDESSVPEIVMTEKEIHISFAITSQMAKVMATVCDKRG